MKQLAIAFNKIATALTIFAVLSPVFAAGTDEKVDKKTLTEEQKIIHVLNRLGFGARPGDVERVKRMGLQKYIDQQLNAGSIDDSIAEAKVRDLEVFGMTTAEVFAKYPNGGALLRQLGEDPRRQAAEKNMGSAGMPDQTEMTEADRRDRQRKLQELYRKYDLRPAGQINRQVTANRVLRAAYSERQLQEVMVDFWQNHFNVFAGKAAVRWFIPSYERDVLRKNALGNFRDLVVGTAQHPAMLFFLDNFQSVSPNAHAGNAGNNRLQRAIRDGELTPQMRERIKRNRGMTDEQLDRQIQRAKRNQQRQRRGLNENYARELMELHTLGVDGGYTQQDIVEVAKAFTGWTIADPRGYRSAAATEIKGSEDRRVERLQRQAGVPSDIESGEFYFNERWHDKSTKAVLGQKINEGGINDGLKVIDILVKHPSTAKLIARKLAVKFVSDNPSDAFVGRIANAFQKSNGDIKATLRAIFTDEEFYAPENYRAKIKTPFELAVSSIRALGADTNSSPAFIAMLTKLGEVPYGYQAPTGYPDTAEDWVNTGALLERLNFAVAIASNRIPGTRVDLKKYQAADKREVLDRAIGSILNGEVSPGTRSTLAKQLEQPLPDVKAAETAKDPDADMPEMPGQGGRRMNRQARLLQPSGDPAVFKAVSLVLGTPEFQRQ
jgi:uncharacterized protein (DUF1800 family)